MSVLFSYLFLPLKSGTYGYRVGGEVKYVNINVNFLSKEDKFGATYG